MDGIKKVQYQEEKDTSSLSETILYGTITLFSL